MEPLFDVSKQFRIGIISGERKVALVRYPKDEEWCERSRKIKSLRQNIGRGKTRPMPNGSERIDADLFASIRCEGCPDLDASEAADVIRKLDRVEVTTVTREPGGYRIECEAMRRKVSHLLKLPTKHDVIVHDRMTVDPVDNGRMQEIRVFLEPSGELYDKLVLGSQGYSGPVPINHKFAVIFELLAQIHKDEEEVEEDDPEA